MRFIELSSGVSVCQDKIESVEQGSTELTSIVRIGGNTYTSTFPYQVLLQLLESDYAVREEEKGKEEVRKQQEFNILKTSGYFAG